MYKLVYGVLAEEVLKSFIDAYKNVSLLLYFDTGIEDEDIILTNYVRAGDALYRTIKDKNLVLLTEKQVLGRKADVGQNMYLIHYNLGSFHFCIHYTEDTAHKTRYIEHIEITKKT